MSDIYRIVYRPKEAPIPKPQYDDLSEALSVLASLKAAAQNGDTFELVKVTERVVNGAVVIDTARADSSDGLVR